MKKLTGTITSLKNDQTVIVKVDHRFKHPLYQKFLHRSHQYACQAEDKTGLVIGQKVTIESCRPISKTKHFRLVTESKQPTKKVTQKEK